MRTTKPNLTCYCQLCAATGERKNFFKLRDGPIDWWFCNDDHALEWLDQRHSCPERNAFLKLTPEQRRCARKE